MRRWFSRLFRIVVLVALAGVLTLSGYSVWHYQSGGTTEELVEEMLGAKRWAVDDDTGVTRFVRRALVPVAQPGRAFEHARDLARRTSEGSVEWLKAGQRWLTDGSARLRGIAEREAQNAPPYSELLQTAGAMLDTGQGGRSGVPGVQLYFGPDAAERDAGISGALVRFVEEAEVSIVCACDALDWQPLAASLVAARRRGLEVGVVTQERSAESAAVRLLQESGVRIEFDDRAGRLRHRFCVADGRAVWVGGVAFTRLGLFQDYGSALVARSPELAANYLAEFEEMYVDQAYGRRSPAETAYPRFALGEVPVENYFSPEDGVENQIVAELAEANERVDFLAHRLTSRRLGDALLARMVYGVSVRGITDRGAAEEERDYAALLAERGAEIYAEESAGLIEHGVIVVDYRTVIVGSYPFTDEANTKQDASILVIESAPMAARFLSVMDEMIEP